MTFGERDSIDEDVLTALRADANTAVPTGSRERVLRRLGMGLGVLGATATVTTGAGALVAGTVAMHSTAVLVSTLAIGVGIGFGAHSGLDAIRRPSLAGAPSALVSHAPAPAPAVPRVPERASEPPARPPAPVAAPVATVMAADAPKPVSVRARPVLAAAESRVPTPVLAPPGLAAQQSLLDEARSALVRSDGTSALSAIGAHRLRFPDTALAEERATLEIRALLTLGRIEEARARHGVFERAFPGSLFGPSLRRLVPSGASHPESVTDASAAPQLKE